jgi:predicted Zn-dependent peptidase
MRYTLALTLALAVTVAAQAPPDRSHPPQPGPVPTLHLPAIQKRTLSNGLPVWIVEMHKVPVAQVNLVVLSGTSDDPTGKFGAANMTVTMLEEGAGSRDSLQIADAVDFLGADLTSGAAVDSSGVRLHVPVARLSDALPIMGDVVERPTFPNDELQRLREQRLTALLQARDDPPTIAAVTFSRVLYGATHRYGTMQMGTAATIKAMSTADIKAFYAASFRPDNGVLLAVGDVSPSTLLPQLEKTFGSWKPSGPLHLPMKIPAAPQHGPREIYLVDKPGAAQSQIRIGWIGVPRSTPDYFPIQVMNTILGGSFSSRLNMNLREQHGYTYGAASVFDYRMSAGPFAASAGVQTDKTADALKEFFIELDGIRKPVPAEELARAKNYVALRYPGAFETTGDMSRRLEDAIVYHLPDDYFSKYVQNIQAVTAADVQRVADKYIQPDKFAVVIVGDRQKIEGPIKALNLAPIKVMTVDEIFGPM